MLYKLALLVHLLGAIVFFAGIAVAGVSFSSARKRSRPGEIVLLFGLSRVGVAFVAGGSVLVLGSGLSLVEVDDRSLREPWLAAALSLFVASLFLGWLGGRKPKQARLTAVRLAREGDSPTDELTTLLEDRVSLALNVAAVAAALAVLGLMAWQPGA